MPEWTTPLLIALASGGFLTGLAALLNSRSAARKDEMQSLRETIKTLQEENARLKKQWTDLSNENQYYRRWAERLCYQVISLGGVPCDPDAADPVIETQRKKRRLTRTK